MADGNHYADGLNVTIARYDRRGLQTSTRLPFRQLAGSTMASFCVEKFSWERFRELGRDEIDARLASFKALTDFVELT